MSAGKKAVGVDIGGTKIAVAGIGGEGEICARKVIPTEAERGFQNAVDRIVTAVQEIVSEAEWAPADLAGIGIGCAGPVDPQSGKINNAYTLSGWQDCDIVSPLEAVFGVPVRLENDADAAALGECFAGAGRGFNRVVMLTFGTGIGGATVLEGEIYRGCGYQHPELGHIPINVLGPGCYCGINGCFESIASGWGINQAAREEGIDGTREVFRLAAAGDASAVAILNRALEATRMAAWTIVHTLLPERIILGGGMIDEHYALFAPPIEESCAAARLVLPNRITVAPAQLGNRAGVVGAASLFLSCG